MKKEGVKLILIFVFISLLISLVSSQNYSVNVTNEHPFLLSNGSYIPASQLQVGMQLMTINGKKAIVSSITDVHSDVSFPVFNLEASPFSDFVLPGGVVVHNSNLPSGKNPVTYDELVKLIKESGSELSDKQIKEAALLMLEGANPELIGENRVLFRDLIDSKVHPDDAIEMIKAATKTEPTGGITGPDSIFGMTPEQIKSAGIKTRSFYAVVSQRTACRLKAGGTIADPNGETFTWPTSPERAHIGPGFYAWDNINSALAYRNRLIESGRSGLKIVEVQFSENSLNKMRQLNVDKLGETGANDWLDKHSQLFTNDPCKVTPTDYDYIIRGTQFGNENFFTPEMFKKGALVGIKD